MADRLVVVDDEVELARFVSRVAESIGYEVRVASQVRDFKNIIMQWNPHVIILDLAMPEMDGVELLRWLSSENCRAQIVIMSGFDTRTLDAAKRLGQERGLHINSTVGKPVRVQALKDILELLKQPKADAINKADIERGLEKDEFFLLYQPKVSLKTGKLYGAEALVYWEHPQHGLLSSDRFTDAAEETGVMDDLIDFMLVNAIRQEKAWMGDPLNLQMAVNLSFGNLNNPILSDRISALCNAEHVPADRIVLEVKESSVMYSSLEVLDTLTRLRLKGFSLSIDNFGTGLSSLARLRRLPVTEIKIDRSFVNEMLTSSSGFVIVKAMVNLAHNMGLLSVAEGIEDAEHYRLLAEMGCDLGQGQGIAKPLTADAFHSWAKHWKSPINLSNLWTASVISMIG